MPLSGQSGEASVRKWGFLDPQAGPLDFIARLAALVPKPRLNLTRFHGVFDPQQSRPPLGDTGEAGEGRQTQSRRGGAREDAG